MVLDKYNICSNSRVRRTILALLTVSHDNTRTIYFTPSGRRISIVGRLANRTVARAHGILVRTTQVAHNRVHPLTRTSTTRLSTLVIPKKFNTTGGLDGFTALNDRYAISHRLGTLTRTVRRTKGPLNFVYVTPTVLPGVFSFPLHLAVNASVSATRILRRVNTRRIPYPISSVIISRSGGVIAAPTCVLTRGVTRTTDNVSGLISHILILTR